MANISDRLYLRTHGNKVTELPSKCLTSKKSNIQKDFYTSDAFNEMIYKCYHSKRYVENDNYKE